MRGMAGCYFRIRIKHTLHAASKVHMPEVAAWALRGLMRAWICGDSKESGGCLGWALATTLGVGRNKTADGPDSMGRFSPISSQESLLTSAVDQCVNGARESRQ